MHIVWEAEFWVAVAFVVFLAGLFYAGVHKTVADALDKRRSRIQSELDEAARLKSEAMALLAEYRQKTANAEQEAAAIIESAKADAERLAAEAHAKLEDFVARRTKMAEIKIAQAEAQALADVRNIAAEVAAGAAEKVLALSAKGAVGEQLIARGIEDVKRKLN
jgi:F-type H+-transporting ATPase subunit b